MKLDNQVLEQGLCDFHNMPIADILSGSCYVGEGMIFDMGYSLLSGLALLSVGCFVYLWKRRHRG